MEYIKTYQDFLIEKDSKVYLVQDVCLYIPYRDYEIRVPRVDGIIPTELAAIDREYVTEPDDVEVSLEGAFVDAIERLVPAKELGITEEDVRTALTKESLRKIVEGSAN